MSYIEPSTDVRLFTGLSDSDINSANLVSLTSYATIQLNRDINHVINDERVDWISNEKQNKIDGSNTVFYAKEVHKNTDSLGDFNNDGSVNSTDIAFYTIDSSGDRTVYSVASLDSASIGKFTLSSAPDSNEKPFINYAVAPIDEVGPDNLIKMACVQLVAALSFTRIDAKKISKYKIGKVTISRQSEAFDTFYGQYKRTICKINAKMDSIGDNISQD